MRLQKPKTSEHNTMQVVALLMKPTIKRPCRPAGVDQMLDNHRRASAISKEKVSNIRLLVRYDDVNGNQQCHCVTTARIDNQARTSRTRKVSGGIINLGKHTPTLKKTPPWRHLLVTHRQRTHGRRARYTAVDQSALIFGQFSEDYVALKVSVNYPPV